MSHVLYSATSAAAIERQIHCSIPYLRSQTVSVAKKVTQFLFLLNKEGQPSNQADVSDQYAITHLTPLLDAVVELCSNWFRRLFFINRSTKKGSASHSGPTL